MPSPLHCLATGLVEVSGLGMVVGPPEQGPLPRTVIVPQMVATELEQHME
jgi:hypothetical protein